MIMENSRYFRPIRRGEYDLANISLVGADPITGLSFDACQAEWDRARSWLLREFDGLRWWQIVRRYKLSRQAWALRTHLGF